MFKPTTERDYLVIRLSWRWASWWRVARVVAIHVLGRLHLDISPLAAEVAGCSASSRRVVVVVAVVAGIALLLAVLWWRGLVLLGCVADFAAGHGGGPAGAVEGLAAGFAAAALRDAAEEEEDQDRGYQHDAQEHPAAPGGPGATSVVGPVVSVVTGRRSVCALESVLSRLGCALTT